MMISLLFYALLMSGAFAKTVVNNPTNKGDDFCDFEQDLCNWKDVKPNGEVTMKWSNHTGTTSTPQTGPTADHTSKLGKYLYIEASCKVFKDRAQLKSKSYSKDFRCLSFWLNMNGVDVWQVNVFKVTTTRTYRAFNANYNTRNKWWKANVNLEGTENFEIIIEGLRGTGELSDIAIDDVTVSRTVCNTTDIDRDYPNFRPYVLARAPKNGLVSIFQLADMPDHWPWQVGPVGRITAQSTFYVQLDSGARKSGDKSLLLLDGIKDTDGCLTFTYKYFKSNATLNIYQESLSSSPSTLLTTIYSPGNNNTMNAKVLFQGSEKIQQLVFEGIVDVPEQTEMYVGVFKLHSKGSKACL